MTFEVLVNDLDNVMVNGESSGSVTDVLFNHYDPIASPGMKSTVLAALHAWDNARNAVHEQEVIALRQGYDNLLAASTTSVDQLKAALVEQSKLTKKALDDLAATEEIKVSLISTREEHEAEVARLNTLFDEQSILLESLGGETLAKAQVRKDREQELLNQQAKIQAELASIQKGV